MYFWSTTGEVDLDFIEIGTSYFDTLIEKASDETYGISIEPLKVYLDRLPNKKNVLKINCAISKNNKETEDYIYYIKPEFITEEWMAGSNLIGDFHPLHKKLNLTHLVDSQKIKLIPLEKILTENKIRKINFLKIDTEGFDSFIVEGLLPYLKSKNKIYWPKKIQFETNEWSDIENVKKVINEYEKIGYKRIKKDYRVDIEWDTILELL